MADRCSSRAFRKSCNDVIESRRAMLDLNTMYTDLTAEELDTVTDKTCIICREDMQIQQSIKRLDCQHVFHKHCLRSWFQRQQTCQWSTHHFSRVEPLDCHRSYMSNSCSAINDFPADDESCASRCCSTIANAGCSNTIASATYQLSLLFYGTTVVNAGIPPYNN